MRPAVSTYVDGGTEINVIGLKALRAELLPPIQVAGLPMLKSPLQAAVAGEIDVVGDLLGIVDAHLKLSSNQKSALSRSRTVSKPHSHQQR